jgi:hypothetical protein
MVTKLMLELVDYTEYDIFALEDTVAKVRVVHNGALIESVTPDYYHGFTFDTYGPLRLTDYGDLAGTNRTIGIEIHSQYDSTLGADWRIMVRNIQSALAS